MILRRAKRQVCTHILIRPGLCVLLVIFFWFLFYHLPSPPPTKNNNRADRPPPKHRVESTARFLYHSSFRQNADIEYETQLSNALERIEQAVLANNQGDRKAENRIWQIAKDEKHRGADSTAFEEINKEWMYTVSGLHKEETSPTSTEPNRKASH